ncbi:MAG: SH3 domain-containing protein [Lachnospiraceae bacterium]|nr:SH3 domain-containing protein [Lachnospiraceae bacterium]
MKNTIKILICGMIVFYLIAGGIALLLSRREEKSNQVDAQLFALQNDTIIGNASEDAPLPTDAGSEEDADVADAGSEDSSEADAVVVEVHYYAFSLQGVSSHLNVREEPSLISASIAKLKPGATGYVLSQEDSWSRILTSDGIIGYCYNDYLALTEIPVEDFPAEYR